MAGYYDNSIKLSWYYHVLIYKIQTSIPFLDITN